MHNTRTALTHVQPHLTDPSQAMKWNKTTSLNLFYLFFSCLFFLHFSARSTSLKSKPTSSLFEFHVENKYECLTTSQVHLAAYSVILSDWDTVTHSPSLSSPLLSLFYTTHLLSFQSIFSLSFPFSSQTFPMNLLLLIHSFCDFTRRWNIRRSVYRRRPTQWNFAYHSTRQQTSKQCIGQISCYPIICGVI